MQKASSIQVIIANELNKEQHIWLNSLTDHLTDLTQATILSNAYEPHQDDPEYQNFMNIIIRANIKVQKGDSTMCEALYELFAPQLQTNWDNGVQYGLQQGRQQGQKQTLQLCGELIKTGRLDELARAAKEPAYLEALLTEFGLS